MFLIDFDQTAQQAFIHGFVKGLASPVVMYHSETAPRVPNVTYLTAPSLSTDNALAGDWARIGLDLKNVADQYGKESAAKTTSQK